MPLCILATVPPQRAMKATTTMYGTGTQDRTLCFTTVAAFGLTLDCLQLRLQDEKLESGGGKNFNICCFF